MSDDPLGLFEHSCHPECPCQVDDTPPADFELDPHDHACCPPDDCCGGPCAAHPCWELTT